MFGIFVFLCFLVYFSGWASWLFYFGRREGRAQAQADNYSSQRRRASKYWDAHNDIKYDKLTGKVGDQAFFARWGVVWPIIMAILLPGTFVYYVIFLGPYRALTSVNHNGFKQGEQLEARKLDLETPNQEKEAA